MYKQYHGMSPEITADIFDRKSNEKDAFDVFQKSRKRTIAYGDNSLRCLFGNNFFKDFI